MVKSLSSLLSQKSKRALKYSNREYASNKAKATAFVVEYAKVSGCKSDNMSKRTVRGLQRDARRLQGSPRQPLEFPFTLDELRRALHQLKPGKASVLDGIDPKMLKQLLPAALPVLLQLLNTSWTTTQQRSSRSTRKARALNSSRATAQSP